MLLLNCLHTEWNLEELESIEFRFGWRVIGNKQLLTPFEIIMMKKNLICSDTTKRTNFSSVWFCWLFILVFYFFVCDGENQIRVSIIVDFLYGNALNLWSGFFVWLLFELRKVSNNYHLFDVDSLINGSISAQMALKSYLNLMHHETSTKHTLLLSTNHSCR